MPSLRKRLANGMFSILLSDDRLEVHTAMVTHLPWGLAQYQSPS